MILWFPQPPTWPSLSAYKVREKKHKLIIQIPIQGPRDVRMWHVGFYFYIFRLSIHEMYAPIYVL